VRVLRRCFVEPDSYSAFSSGITLKTTLESDQMDIKDKVIVITGGAQGLGLAMAKEFAAKGAKLALVDLNEEPMAAAVATCVAIGGRGSYGGV
jgi:NADPH-dependent 2,4-dienoyl-CoA reductase/sulfur reductase-like enzyme